MPKVMEVVVQMVGGHGKSTLAAIIVEALKDCKIPVKYEDGDRQAGDITTLLEDRTRLIRNTLSISEREKLCGGYVLVKTKALNQQPKEFHAAVEKPEEKPVTVDWTMHMLNKPMSEHLGTASNGMKFRIGIGMMWREEFINYKPSSNGERGIYSGNIYCHLHYWHKNEWAHLENVQLAQYGLPRDCELSLTDSLQDKTDALLAAYINAVPLLKRFAEVLAGQKA